MKKISVKGLAEYMTSSATAQRSILRQYKYPDEDSSRAKILYYREARDRIVAFHRTKKDPAWLLAEAASLNALAMLSAGRTRTRLNHNARALRDYNKSFGDKIYKILPDISLAVAYGDIRVTAFPDLHVREGTNEKIIKLDFSVERQPDEVARIICQVFFEAANLAGINLPSKNVLFVDVTRGRELKEARVRSRTLRNIEATCESISAIWDRI